VNNTISNILIEIGILCLLGILYFFYQRNKILTFEKNKTPMMMGLLLQSLLAERGEQANPDIDPIIEALDDYLQNKTINPPTKLLTQYASSPTCGQEMKDIILEALGELNENTKK